MPQARPNPPAGGPERALARLLASRPLAWLDERLDLRARLAPWLAGSGPALTAWPQLLWRYLGGLGLMLLALEALTGLALLPFYRAEPGQALASLAAMESALPAGALLRRLHAVGGHLLLLLAAFHAFKALAQAAHFKPRELSWLSGWLLFLMVLALVYSGGLLPLSQASQEQMAALWPGWSGRPGAGVLGWALALHLGLPLIMLALAWLHLVLNRALPRASARGEAAEGGAQEPFYPLGLIHAGLATVGCLLLLFTLAVLWPQPFLAPTLAPPPAMPGYLPGYLPWYLWAPAGLAGLLPAGWGLALILLLLLAPGLWPFLERGPARSLGRRPWLSKLLPLAVALWVLLSFWGALRL